MGRYLTEAYSQKCWMIAGTDPGFPIGGGTNPLGGVPTYDFAKFCEKLHEIEKMLGRRGSVRRGRPQDPPLGSYQIELVTKKKFSTPSYLIY